VLQSISTEDMISNRMARFKALWASYDPPYAAQYDVDQLEFDPIRINQECNSFFEALVRDRVNQACRAVTLAFSVGGDLYTNNSRYPYGVPRLMYDVRGNQLTQAQVDAGAVVASYETDSAYRTRIWLSPSILSLNGPGMGTYESYVFWALSTPMPPGERPIRHASAFTKRATGHVYIPIMTDDFQPDSKIDLLTGDLVTNDPGSPTPTDAQIVAVYNYITDKGFARKGLTDVVSILRPQITRTDIRANITLFPGVDSTTLMGEVNTAVQNLVAAIRWLGADLTILSIETALGQTGVYNVELLEPTADVVVGQSGVIKVDQIRLHYAGVGE